MPPQVALSQERTRRHLYELLRPEFVKSNPVPLSSDALTGMGKYDPERLKHNDEVKEACVRLFKVVIPEFAAGYEAKGDSFATITPDEVRLFDTNIDRNPDPASKIDELVQVHLLFFFFWCELLLP